MDMYRSICFNKSKNQYVVEMIDLYVNKAIQNHRVSNEKNENVLYSIEQLNDFYNFHLFRIHSSRQ